MIHYSVKFDDGELFSHAKSFEEAEQIRSENNFNYINRSLHIYATLSSNCYGCKLYIYPEIIKLV